MCATFGGPVIHNRTFFFGAYEGTRIRNGSTGQGNVPTAAQWSGDFSRLGYRNNLPIFDPATTAPNPAGSGFVRSPFPGNIIPGARITTFGKGIQQIYPLPQFDVATGNNLFLPLSNLSDNNQAIGRVDHYFGTKTSISARYNIFTGLQTGMTALPLFRPGHHRPQPEPCGQCSAHFQFPHDWELRLGYNRPNYFLVQEGSGGTNYATLLGINNLLKDAKSYGVPSLGISGFSGIGDGTEPNGQLFNIYMLISQFTLIRGPHTIKFGGEGRKTNYNDRGRDRRPRGVQLHRGAHAESAEPQQHWRVCRRPSAGFAVDRGRRKYFALRQLQFVRLLHIRAG